MNLSSVVDVVVYKHDVGESSQCKLTLASVVFKPIIRKRNREQGLRLPNTANSVPLQLKRLVKHMSADNAESREEAWVDGGKCNRVDEQETLHLE